MMNEEIDNWRDKKEKIKNEMINLVKKEKIKRDKQKDKINEQIS